MTVRLFAGFLFASLLALSPAAAYEMEDSGFKLSLDAAKWTEEAPSYDASEFGGSHQVWFVGQKGKSDSQVFLVVVEARPAEYADAHDWQDKVILAEDAAEDYLKWYAKGDTIKSRGTPEAEDVVIGSGQKARVAKIDGLKINRVWPKVAFISIESPDKRFWISAMISNGRAIESVDGYIKDVLKGMSFSPKPEKELAAGN